MSLHGMDPSSALFLWSPSGNAGASAVHDDGDSFRLTQIYIFVSLQLFGLVGSCIMLLTALVSPIVHRQPAWYNFVLSWIFSGVSYSLLLTSGHVFERDNEPDFALCAVQCTLIHAAPPVLASATMGLVVQTYHNVNSIVVAKYDVPVKRYERLWSYFILGFPYILLIAVLVETSVIIAHCPEVVRKSGSGMYCSFRNPIPGRVSAGLCILILLPTVVLELMLAWKCKRNWAIFQHNVNARAMMIRVGIFSVFGMLAFVLGCVFFFTLHHGGDLNIIISSLPVAAVLVFSSQRDVLRSWMFWKWQLPCCRRREKSNPDSLYYVDSNLGKLNSFELRPGSGIGATPIVILR